MLMTTRYRLALLLSILLPAIAFATPAEISRAGLKALQAAGEPLVIVDVRSAAEFAQGHVPGAVNIPHDEIRQRARELEAYRAGGNIVLYCRSGRRVGVAAQALEARGFGHLLHLEGDMPGWAQAGEPVTPCTTC